MRESKELDEKIIEIIFRAVEVEAKSKTHNIKHAETPREWRNAMRAMYDEKSLISFLIDPGVEFNYIHFLCDGDKVNNIATFLYPYGCDTIKVLDDIESIAVGDRKIIKSSFDTSEHFTDPKKIVYRDYNRSKHLRAVVGSENFSIARTHNVMGVLHDKDNAKLKNDNILPGFIDPQTMSKADIFATLFETSIVEADTCRDEAIAIGREMTPRAKRDKLSNHNVGTIVAFVPGEDHSVEEVFYDDASKLFDAVSNFAESGVRNIFMVDNEVVECVGYDVIAQLKTMGSLLVTDDKFTSYDRLNKKIIDESYNNNKLSLRVHNVVRNRSTKSSIEKIVERTVGLSSLGFGDLEALYMASLIAGEEFCDDIWGNYRDAHKLMSYVIKDSVEELIEDVTIFSVSSAFRDMPYSPVLDIASTLVRIYRQNSDVVFLSKKELDRDSSIIVKILSQAKRSYLEFLSEL